jgi:hypothetical protein
VKLYQPERAEISCECGGVDGRLDLSQAGRLVCCYCRDCQAFARFLGRADSILDPQGGTLILQSEPRFLTFTRGADKLGCVRLTDKGLLRWHASCCNTAIGNTLPNMKAAFVGIIHDCIRRTPEQLTGRYGPVSVYVHTRSAIGTRKPKERGLLRTLLEISWQLLRARLTGAYRQTPFFDVSTGDPIATPYVLTKTELAAVKSVET